MILYHYLTTMILFVLFLDQFNIAAGQYAFADKSSLVTAVNSWTSDENSAALTYGPIDSWDVSGVTDMSYLFQNKNSFNGNISNWNVGSVTTMQGAFYGASSFNVDISDWDVSGVIVMQDMFHGALSFNVDISDWDVSGVTTMQGMFNGASAFSQHLCWDVSGKVVSDMLTGTNFATVYDCTGEPTSQPTNQPTTQPTRDTSFKKHVKNQVDDLANAVKSSLVGAQSELSNMLNTFRRAIQPPGY